MRVVYKSILDRVTNAIRNADEQGRPIDYIELSKDEWRQLGSELSNLRLPVLAAQREVYYIGVRLVREDHDPA